MASGWVGVYEAEDGETRGSRHNVPMDPWSLPVSFGELEGPAFGDVRVRELAADADEFLLAADERLDDFRIEMLARLIDDHVPGLLVRECHLVGALGGQGV